MQHRSSRPVSWPLATGLGIASVSVILVGLIAAITWDDDTQQGTAPVVPAPATSSGFSSPSPSALPTSPSSPASPTSAEPSVSTSAAPPASPSPLPSATPSAPAPQYSASEPLVAPPSIIRITPGTYSYRTADASRNGKVLVSTPTADGYQHLVYGDDTLTTDLLARFDQSGLRIRQLRTTVQGKKSTFNFSPSILAIPAFAPRGTTWSRTVTDAKTGVVAKFSGIVEGAATDTVDGRQIAVKVLSFTLRLTGRDYDVTVQETDHVDLSGAVITSIDSVRKGTLSGKSYSAQLTQQLLSASPGR